MANWIKKTRTSLTILLCCFAINATASNISVYPMVADITAKNRFQDIQVLNDGSDTAYVAVSIYRVNNPGQPNQSFTELADNPYQVGLIVTPNKMVIPTGQMRISRVLYIGKPLSSDVVYEVKFTPVSGQLIAIGTGNSEINAGLQLIISYGVAIFVRPTVPSPNIQITRVGTALTLTNKGNTTVQVGNCKQCTTESQCNILATLTTTLYPQNVFHYTLPQDLPVSCTQQVLQNQYSPFKIN